MHCMNNKFIPSLFLKRIIILNDYIHTECTCVRVRVHTFCHCLKKREEYHYKFYQKPTTSNL